MGYFWADAPFLRYGQKSVISHNFLIFEGRPVMFILSFTPMLLGLHTPCTPMATAAVHNKETSLLATEVQFLQFLFYTVYSIPHLIFHKLHYSKFGISQNN